MKILPALEFLTDAGVSDFLSDTPRKFYAASTVEQVLQPQPEPVAAVNISAPQIQKPKLVISQPEVPAASLNSSVQAARDLADSAKTLADLREAVESFEGCSLKKMANKTVFADGNPESRIMLIGEAPGADEDIQGIPFCGQSGQLLDKVLKSAGLDRQTGFYVTNTLFWRPPGNRKPTPEELAMCEPFLEKHIALVNPKILLLVGATAVQGVLKNNESMGKLRGKIFHYNNRYMQNNVPVMVTYHPSFLMRAPINKRLAWDDMLQFREFLDNQA